MSVFSDNVKAANAAAKKGMKPRTLIELLGRWYGWLLGQTIGRILRLVLPKRVTDEQRIQIAYFVSLLATPIFFAALVAGVIYASTLLFGNWFVLPLILLGCLLLIRVWRLAGSFTREEQIGKR